MPEKSLSAEALTALYTQLREDYWQRWGQDLPFTELAFDRWERARRLGFGEGAVLYQSACLYGEVKVGRHTWIGPQTILDGRGGIVIGDWCSISAGVHIYTHDSVRWALSGGRAEYGYAPVRIGDCSYVGPQTVITRGVSVGDHSVIGALSLVKEDVPPYSVAVGAPCRVVGRVEIEGDRVNLVYEAGEGELA